LKTLEEPPAHVVFILATTEAHKLPETIISRTQRHNFKPVSEENVVKHLKQLAKAEKIKAEDDALRLIARFGEGSFRDSISLLDQLSAHTPITADDVQKNLGTPTDTAVDNLIRTVKAGDIPEIVSCLQT